MSSQVKMIGSAELQVIQATLRVDEDRDAAIRTAAQKALDWQQVQQLAKHHRVLPLVYKRLKEVTHDLVPSEAMQSMATWQKAHELRVFWMTADLIKVVRALEAENIPVICLKGPVLAAFQYGDPAMRDFGDLDILVKKSDYARAEGVLRGMGAVLAYADREVTMDQHRHNNIIIGCSHLEIHWCVTRREFPRALEIDGLFARSQKVPVNGQMLCTLSIEDMIIHACQHGTQHYWAMFRYLADFASALRMIDATYWEVLFKAVRGQGLYRPLLICIGLCQSLLGVELPENTQHAIQRDALTRWTICFVHAYLRRTGNTGPDFIDSILFNLFIAERERFYFLNKLMADMFIPTAMDYQWIVLPDSQRWLYPILRPVRRAERVLAMLFTRIR